MKLKIVSLILIYFLITQASAANYTQILRPNGVGDLTQLTPNIGGENYQMVYEESSDGDATFVWRAGSSFSDDLFELEDHVGSGVINSVTVFTMSRESQSSGTGSHRAMIKSGTTTTISGGTVLTTSYVSKARKYSTNPDTDNSWTWEEIDDLQAGVGLYKQTGYGTARCTQVWVVVDYEYIPTIDIR